MTQYKEVYNEENNNTVEKLSSVPICNLEGLQIGIVENSQRKNAIEVKYGKTTPCRTYEARLKI